MVGNSVKKRYCLYDPETGATVECTEKYLFQWIARGFKVKSIKIDKDK
jgi:hypothetical protein